MISMPTCLVGSFSALHIRGNSGFELSTLGVWYLLDGDSAFKVNITCVCSISGGDRILNLCNVHSMEEPSVYFDAAVDQRIVKSTHSLLCVPILDEESHVVGACEVLNSPRGGHHGFTDDDAQVSVPVIHV